MGRKSISNKEYVITNSIRVLRAEYNMNQKTLADKVGVTRQTISSMENGNYSPSLILAYRIAKVFDRQIEDVFNFIKKEN